MTAHTDYSADVARRYNPANDIQPRPMAKPDLVEYGLTCAITDNGPPPVPMMLPGKQSDPFGPADNTGLRYDTGKNRLDLIPPEWEWALGEVLTAGAAKYADRNWEKGMDWSKVVGPMRRHVNKFLRGESYDDETGCHHLAHVAWNALALMSYDLRGIGTDNAVWHGPTLETKKVH